ncbi:hypothetical protein F4678DRAFT_471749 [Xylaria arbuscula]|nr:hypothetical protein F4678DRAFT_471749 [Xylaria arbuscula]
MDPASIVQIIGTAVSLGDVVVKCIAGLRMLKSKYHEAPLVISTIIGQLYMVQSALDQLLNDATDMTATQRLAFLWGEQQTSEYSVLLDRQANALNLLLQAVHCNTSAQQQGLLFKTRSQSILRQAEYCSSSIIGLKDSASFVSEDTAGISLTFDFDAVVLASKIYQRARKSYLRQSIRARQPHSRQTYFSVYSLSDTSRSSPQISDAFY